MGNDIGKKPRQPLISSFHYMRLHDEVKHAARGMSGEKLFKHFKIGGEYETSPDFTAYNSAKENLSEDRAQGAGLLLVTGVGALATVALIGRMVTSAGLTAIGRIDREAVIRAIASDPDRMAYIRSAGIAERRPYMLPNRGKHTGVQDFEI